MSCVKWMRNSIIVLSGLFFFAGHSTFGAIDPSTLQKGRYNQLTYTFPAGSGTSAGKSITYLLYLPVSYSLTAKLPLITHMHGGGAKSSWPDAGLSSGGYLLPFLGLNSNWTEASHPCVILEPFCSPSWCGPCWDSLCSPAGPQIHNLSKPPTGLQVVKDFIPIVLKDLALDSNRNYVTGWSNGGAAAWDFIMYWPTFFAASIPIAGAGDTMSSHAIRGVNVPVWAGASQDDDVVPFIGTKSMVDKLTALGGTPRHTYVTGWQHFSEGAIWQTPEVVPWLFSQVRTGGTKVAAGRFPTFGSRSMDIRIGANGSLLKLGNLSGVISGGGLMSLTIYRADGRSVRTFNLTSARHDADGIALDTKDSHGKSLSPGKYLCRLHSVNATETGSFVVVP